MCGKSQNLIYYRLRTRNNQEIISYDFIVHLYRIYVKNSRQLLFYLNKYNTYILMRDPSYPESEIDVIQL